MIFQCFQLNVVMTALGSLNGSQSRDVLDLDSPFLKKNRLTICKPPNSSNESIYEKLFPSHWKIAKVSSVFQSGGSTAPSNYTPIGSEIAEIVCDQLVARLNDGAFNFDPMSFRLRKYHSTESAIWSFVERIESCLNDGGVVGAVFLDFTRAFDPVNQNFLLSKMSKCNFCWRIKWDGVLLK